MHNTSCMILHFGLIIPLLFQRKIFLYDLHTPFGDKAYAIITANSHQLKSFALPSFGLCKKFTKDFIPKTARIKSSEATCASLMIAGTRLQYKLTES